MVALGAGTSGTLRQVVPDLFERGCTQEIAESIYNQNLGCGSRGVSAESQRLGT
jgi:hypothetical protein